MLSNDGVTFNIGGDKFEFPIKFDAETQYLGLPQGQTTLQITLPL